jgi:hypothetical protein
MKSNHSSTLPIVAGTITLVEPRARRRRAANCGFHGHCALLSFPALPFATEPRLGHVAKRREAVWRSLLTRVWHNRAVWRNPFRGLAINA